MSKKKEIKAFKEGIEAGVKPLKRKFDEISEMQGESLRVSSEIRRAQRKGQRLTNDLIDDTEDMNKKIDHLQNQREKDERKQRRIQKEIDDLKVHMPGHVICEGCGKSLMNKQIVCSNCGKIVDKLPYDLKTYDVEYKEIEELKELARVIKNSKKDPTWIYPERKDEFYKMKKIQDIAKEGKRQKGENGKHYERILKETREFFRKYNDEKIEIALVGTVKAGKSSLINALIGAEAASVDATPETSILTKYRTTKNGNYLKIKYYTQSEWNSLWNTVKDKGHFREEYDKTGAENAKYEYLGRKGETIECSRENLSATVMEWTRSDTPKHFFVKEIEVGYESDSDMFPHDVYLVDTPGLNDPVKYRSEITRKYIKKADWVIACTVVENLSSTDTFRTLTSIRNNKNNDVEKIFIVANKKDQLPEEDEKKKADEFLKRLREEYKNNNWDEELAASRFSVISAVGHQCMRRLQKGEKLGSKQYKDFQKILIELGIDPMSAGALGKESVEKVINYAGVEHLFNQMKENVINRKRKEILGEIDRSYYQTMNKIRAIAEADIQKTDAELEQYISDTAVEEQEIDELKEKCKKMKVMQKAIEKIQEKLEIEIQADSIKVEV